MEMIRVNSSAIIAVGYDPQTRRMKIKFSQGSTYDFCRVPEHIFQGLLRAGSKGTYYNDHIRDRYQCY
ncbi:MAG: KTSC domain-containing protein [Deltaproteobacteria bacterium]|nr:KTSC domain-containing protein [Deltaproteobacteria bacterium]